MERRLFSGLNPVPAIRGNTKEIYHAERRSGYYIFIHTISGDRGENNDSAYLASRYSDEKGKPGAKRTSFVVNRKVN
jgi:hypothetical protein